MDIEIRRNRDIKFEVTCEELVSMEGLTDRKILHKMLDRILDTNGIENSAIWVQCFPGPVGGRAKSVTYRLRINAEKTVEYTEL